MAGDEPTPLTIKVYDRVSQQITVVEQALQYTDDATLGTLAEPYIIQLQAAEGIDQISQEPRANRQKLFKDGSCTSSATARSTPLQAYK